MHDPTVERFLPGLGAESCRSSAGVAYVRYGMGEPLVLFHGGSGSWSHWVRNLAALGGHFQVLAFDQPGYGASGDVDPEITNAAYLDLIAQSVDEATDTSPGVHLAGFSFGGSIAAAMAARLGPRAKALSLVGTAGFERPQRRNLPLVSTRRQREQLGRAPTDAELRALHRSNLGVLMIWDKAKVDDLAVDTQVANVARTRFNSRRFSWSGMTPAWLGETRCPATIIYGVHDASAHPSVDHRIALCRAAKPDAQTVLIPDCGHWAMYEAPDVVNGAMIAFHGSV